MSAAPLPITADGLLYDVDPETGEILSVEPVERFEVDSRERADWVLAKLLQIDAELASLEHSQIVQQAKAIIAGAEAQSAALRRKRSALEWRFGPELGAFARREIAGGKSRTWHGLYGSIAFRSAPARLKIVDHDAAGQWALASCPEAAKVECLVSLIPSVIREAILAGEVPAPRGIEVRPASETVTIKTRVGHE